MLLGLEGGLAAAGSDRDPVCFPGVARPFGDDEAGSFRGRKRAGAPGLQIYAFLIG